MKRQFFTLFTAGVLCASLTTGVFAGSPGNERAKLILKLEERAQRVEQTAQTTTGASRQELEMQRLQVRKLIEKIRAGGYVDPQEIDTLLRKGPQ